jgi:hypothetical protein
MADDLLGPPGDGKPLAARRFDVDPGLDLGKELQGLVSRPIRGGQTIEGLGPPGPRTEQDRIDVPIFPDRGGWVVDVRELGPR